jgi:hypothetical protein
MLYQKIVRYPPTRALTPEEKDFLWNFRYYLIREKRVRKLLPVDFCENSALV